MTFQDTYELENAIYRGNMELLCLILDVREMKTKIAENIC